MRNISTILLFILMCLSADLTAQVDSIVLNKGDIDKIIIRDTTKRDSISKISPTSEAKIGKSDIDDIIEYGSKDSSELDKVHQIVRLWGDAYVKYQATELKGYYIELDLKNHIAVAEIGTNEHGRPIGKPNILIDGQQMVANKLKFNYETKKGIIIDARMKQTDLYINSRLTKVIAGPYDSIRTDDVIFQKSALITTCDYPDAHFGIRTSKAKFIPEKVGVIGPAYVEIEGVPTPLVMPFAFFPMTKGRRTGLLFPNNYTFSREWGYGLQNIGYYFPISDKMDLIVRGDLYLRGSHRIEAMARFAKRYKYNGELGLEYATLFTERSNNYNIVKATTYALRANLQQSDKANPYVRFGGSVNLQLGRHKELNFNDANSVLNNTLSSNISFTRLFPGKPYTLTAQMSHWQDTRSRDFTLTLPDISFQTQSIFPFKRKNLIGDEQWYEQISFTYNNKLKNVFNAKDSTLLTQKTLNDSRQGIEQNIAVNASYRIMKYFNLAPSFNYAERWGFNTIRQRFDPSLVYAIDSVFNADKSELLRIDTTIIRDGSVVRDTLHKFHAYRTYSAALSLNTQLFGLIQFKKGFIRALRHQMRPSLGFNFAPNYASYFEYVQSSNNPTIPYTRYSPYMDNLFGGPSFSGQQMGLSISLNNIIEAKIRGKKDTADRKVKIFDNLYLSTFYNLVADSFKLNPLNYGATTRLFKGLTVLNINGQFDFYRSRINRSEDQLIWKNSKKLMIFKSFSATLSTGLTIDAIRKWLRGEDPTKPKEKTKVNETRSLFWDIFNNFSINHVISVQVRDEPGRNRWRFGTNSINLNGSLPVTPKWNITLGFFGYDFRTNTIIYPDLGFSRDLHCWEMGMSWQPIRGTYSFFIRVKPGTLDFLKIPRNKNRADALVNF